MEALTKTTYNLPCAVMTTLVLVSKTPLWKSIKNDPPNITQNIRASEVAVSDVTGSPLLSSPQLGQPAQVRFCSFELNHLIGFDV